MAGKQNKRASYDESDDEYGTKEKIAALEDKVLMLSNAFEERTQQSQSQGPQDRAKSFTVFRAKFVGDPDMREMFLEKYLDQKMKDELNDLNRMSKDSSEPSAQSNTYAYRLLQAINARRPAQTKGESTKPGADLKSLLALRALLLSIFLVSVMDKMII